MGAGLRENRPTFDISGDCRSMTLYCRTWYKCSRLFVERGREPGLGWFSC